MSIYKVDNNLYLVGLNQDIKGFRDFISSWLFCGDINFLVDVGPYASIETLLDALEKLSITRLDYIFLTHIHLDHAGGIGDLVDHFPESKVICSERGIKHLIDPERLWEGSVKTLKDIALKYGKIKATPKEKIISSDEFKLPRMSAIKTPGHAAHHVSYVFDNYLFAGEAGGVFFSFNGDIYLRPATPATFYLEESVESINMLQEMGKKKICYGHFGYHENSFEMLERHKRQLFLWKEVISEIVDLSVIKEEIFDNCISKLIVRDNDFQQINRFDDDLKVREINFAKNSINGYLGYLNSQ